MATAAPIPRLSLDIDDLLCTWAESGSGSIFSTASDDCDDQTLKSAWDDPTSHSRLLDLSDVQASLNAPRPAQVPDIDIKAFLGQHPPQQLGGYPMNQLPNGHMLDSLSPFKGPSYLDWGSSLPPINSQPPSHHLDLCPTDGSWSSRSTLDYQSIGTPDSRNHPGLQPTGLTSSCATCPSPAAAAMMRADGGRSAGSKNSSCESWGTTTTSDINQLVPGLPMPLSQQAWLAQMQQCSSAFFMQQQMQHMQHMQHMQAMQAMQSMQSMQQHEVVGSTACNITGGANSWRCPTFPGLTDPTLNALNVSMQPFSNLPSVQHSPAGKASEQSCSSSNSTEMGQAGAAVNFACMPASSMHGLDLSQPLSGRHSAHQPLQLPAGLPLISTSQLARQASHGGASAQPAIDAQVPVKLERRAESPELVRGQAGSPCSSVGPTHAPHQCVAEEGRKASAVLSRPVGQMYLTTPPALADEFTRSRADALERYRQKRARRAYTKKIRYQLRKINADRRPRIKGRFVKKEEMHKYAHLFPPGTVTDDATENALGDLSSLQEDMLMLDGGSELDLDINGLDMDGDWSL